MNSISFTSLEKNLSSGIFFGEDFSFLRNTWDTLSPEAQQSIFELFDLSSQYVDNAIKIATEKDKNFASNWKEYTLSLIKKQIQNLEQEDQKNETPIALFSVL